MNTNKQPTRPIVVDIPDPYYWYQGSFIDQVAYSHMPPDWKRDQQEREKTMIRDRRTKNGVFVVGGGEDNATIVEAIIGWRDYALALEAYAGDLEQQLKSQRKFG